MQRVDVLLTHSNHLFYDRKQVEKMQPYPPLLTLLVAAVLREAGLSVEVCDISLDAPEPCLQQALDSSKPELVVVCEDDFNFLTKMCLARNRELSFWIAKSAKRAGSRTVVHGSDATDHVAEYLKAGFDYVCFGDVEETIRDLALGSLPAKTQGIAFRDTAGQIRYTGRRPLRKDLDALPTPAWDLISIDQYRNAWQSAHNCFYLSLVSSRGCPYRCNWCAKPLYGNSYRVRSAFLVAQEMLHVKRTYNPDYIWFADDIFGLSAQWTRAFANAVAQLGAVIPFKMQSRCDLMTRETVGALRKAGCREVWMGAESGSQRVLDAMEKGARVEQIYQARHNLSRHDIRAGWFLQFGYPGEGWEDIEATVRMVRETKPDDIGVSVSYPLPGTKFHQLVADQMGQKRNWSESGDLTAMFRTPYSSSFYRALAAALHLEVRKPEDTHAIRSAWTQVYQLKSTAECTGTVA